MYVEKMRRLVEDGADTLNNAKKLLRLFSSYTHKEHIRFDGDQTLFHLLVKNKKPVLLEALLKTNCYQHIASVADKELHTILHYVVRQEEEGFCQQTLDVILKYLPDLMNHIDHEGNTALHLALLHKKIPAIKALVRSHLADTSIPNHEGRTASKLAEHDPELLKAMVYIALPCPDLSFSVGKKTLGSGRNSARKYTITRERSVTGHSVTFPSAASSSSNPMALSSSSVVSFSADLPSKARSTPARGRSYSDSSPKERALIDPIKIEQGVFNKECYKGYPENLFIMLLNVAKEGVLQKHDLLIAAKFIEICTHYPLSSDNQALQDNLFSNPANQQLLRFVLDQLLLYEPSMQKQLEEYQAHIQFRSSQFKLLLEENKTSSEAIPTSDQNVEGSALSRELWTIITSESDSDANIDPFQIATWRIIGLSARYPFQLIIKALIKTFPKLNQHQRLDVNYFVWQMMIHNPSSIDTHREVLKKFRRANNRGLGETGTLLNNALIDLHHVISARAPIMRNIHLFQNWSQAPQFQNERRSFDALINAALAKKAGKRNEEIRLICDELLGNTLSLYQRMTPRDLGDPECSANIAQQKEFKNKLTTYLVNKIFEQPTGKQTNVIQLILEIAEPLCSLGTKELQDLHSLKILVGVLNKRSVSRLKQSFAELSPAEKKTFKKIVALTSDKNNECAI